LCSSICPGMLNDVPIEYINGHMNDHLFAHVIDQHCSACYSHVSVIGENHLKWHNKIGKRNIIAYKFHEKSIHYVICTKCYELDRWSLKESEIDKRCSRHFKYECTASRSLYELILCAQHYVLTGTISHNVDNTIYRRIWWWMSSQYCFI